MTANLVVLEVHESLELWGRRDWLWSHSRVVCAGPTVSILEFPNLKI